MEWDLVPFERFGFVEFGSRREEVSALIGPIEDSEVEADEITEFRSAELPIIRYDEHGVCQIEAFYDVEGVRLGDLMIFEADGLEVMRELERRNGGATISVGIVMFDKLGLTCGRLDEGARGDHSITAFRRGFWDDKLEDFESISFL